MARFTLTIDDKSGKNFGETRVQERGVIMAALQAAMQSFGSTHTHDGNKFTGTIDLAGHQTVGSWTFEPINPQ
jgi:hypothetical protein